MPLSVRRPLNIIDQFKIILPGEPQLQCHLIRYAKEFDRIIVDPAFDILIGNAIDFDLAVHSFENSRIVAIGKVRRRQLNRDQPGFIIVSEVKLRLQLQVGPVLQKIIQNPVTEPVKKEYSR